MIQPKCCGCKQKDWLKKFSSVSKNFDDRARSVRPKTEDSEAVLEAIEPTLAIRTRRVSDELTVQSESSFSRPPLKYLEVPICASHLQNIAKTLTHPSTIVNSVFSYIYIYIYIYI